MVVREITKWIKKWRANKSKLTTNEAFQQATAIRYYGDSGTATTYTSFVNSNPVSAGTIDQLTLPQTVALADKEPGDARIEKKPVEVVEEIIAEKPVLMLNDIKLQIKIVEARLKVLKHYRGQTGDEVRALRYLNARKYYKKYEKLFPWAITTNDLIEKLIRKYKLADRSFGGYSKSVPIEATNELEKFGKAWDKVVDDPQWQPDLKLITDYKGPETKKDPILLASSPFGQWWYVLGAWDKEVEIVDQIIYHNK